MGDMKAAEKLLKSHRGAYIIGHALYEAIKVIEAGPKKKRESSNVRDMKLLMDNLFPTYGVAEKVAEIHKIAMLKPKHIPEVQTKKYVDEIMKKKGEKRNA